MSMKLYVGNLSYEATNESLMELFTPVGEVASATVITDHDTGRSRGFGFVEMNSRQDGEKAIKDLNNKEIDGRSLVVNESRPREDRGGSQGNRRRY